jgi:hypothetical protein
VLGIGLGSLAIPPRPEGEPVTKVTLKKRVDNGPYKSSAYSIRYASQDVAVHRNHVDLIYDVCGLVHVEAGGSQSRIARATGKTLADVKSAPKEGWQECIQPEKGATYVLAIDSGEVKQKARLRITDVNDKELKLEWSLLGPGSEAGTKGQCGGPHDPK